MNNYFNGKVTSPFGVAREYWVNGVKYNDIHNGIDFLGQADDLVRAEYPFRVSRVEDLKAQGGLSVIGFDSSGKEHYYLHNEKLLVKPGRYIKAGDVIAKRGATGRATGEHIHWGVFDYKQRKWINPESLVINVKLMDKLENKVLNQWPDTQALKNYGVKRWVSENFKKELRKKLRQIIDKGTKERKQHALSVLDAFDNGLINEEDWYISWADDFGGNIWKYNPEKEANEQKKENTEKKVIEENKELSKKYYDLLKKYSELEDSKNETSYKYNLIKEELQKTESELQEMQAKEKEKLDIENTKLHDENKINEPLAQGYKESIDAWLDIAKQDEEINNYITKAQLWISRKLKDLPDAIEILIYYLLAVGLSSLAIYLKGEFGLEFIPEITILEAMQLIGGAYLTNLAGYQILRKSVEK